MALNYSPKINRDGLIGYWDAANVKSYPGSGTTWFDLSKNGNNGTMTANITLDANSALSWGDDNDEIKFPDSAIFDFGANPFSVGGWCYLPAAWVNYSGALVNKWNTGGSPGTNEWYVGFAGSATNRWPTFSIEITDGNTLVQAREETNVDVPGWYHIMGVREPNYMKCYLNGELKGNTLVAGNVVNTVADREITVGAFDGIATSGFDGDIAIVQVYDRALTIEDVNDFYNSTKSRFGL